MSGLGFERAYLSPCVSTLAHRDHLGGQVNVGPSEPAKLGRTEPNKGRGQDQRAPTARRLLDDRSQLVLGRRRDLALAALGQGDLNRPCDVLSDFAPALRRLDQRIEASEHLARHDTRACLDQLSGECLDLRLGQRRELRRAQKRLDMVANMRPVLVERRPLKLVRLAFLNSAIGRLTHGDAFALGRVRADLHFMAGGYQEGVGGLLLGERLEPAPARLNGIGSNPSGARIAFVDPGALANGAISLSLSSINLPCGAACRRSGFAVKPPSGLVLRKFQELTAHCIWRAFNDMRHVIVNDLLSRFV